MNASAMIAEREALRMGIEHLTVLFPTEVSSFDFQVENSGRTVQYKLNAQSLRLFGLHSDVNDANRAGANRLQNKKQTIHNNTTATTATSSRTATTRCLCSSVPVFVVLSHAEPLIGRPMAARDDGTFRGNVEETATTPFMVAT